ncbi:MAG: hypothetical protein H6573_08885 [Lewinellaceae bacterium]|nr:hypothetical protein [Lewinellaceae bacterium]
MANDLIGFGNDITKVRAQIPENLEVIYSPVFQKELTERLSTMLSDAEIAPESFSNMAPVFQQLGIPLSLSNMVNILMAGFVIGLRHIIENPFKINRFLAWMMEFVYAIENPNASREHLHTLFQMVYRKHQLSSVNMVNGEAIKKGEVIDYLKIFREEEPSDENYAHYFAYTLRQISAQKVDLFLEEKKQGFDGDFLDFLEVLLIDFEDLIPEKIRVLALRWLENQEEEPNTLSEATMIDDGEPSPPPGYVKIEGRLSTEQIRHFFSFLYRETNGCPSKEPFLSKEEVEALLKFGFCYPAAEPEKKPFELKLSGHKTMGIIYYALFQLLPYHKSTWAPKDYKTHFALFLRHNFRNFEGAPKATIQNNIRGRKPKRMKRGFDLSEYLP